MEEFNHVVDGLTIRIWDNSGQTVDRYTVIVLSWPERVDGWTMLGVDGDGGRHFSQFGHCNEGEHLGKLVKWADVAEKTRKHIEKRLETK